MKVRIHREERIQQRRHPGRVAAGTMLLLALSSVGWTSGQMLQQKDLSFPQVVAGPEFQSVVSITNRGNARYRATAHFWRGEGQDWNPRVNGLQVTGSRLQVVVEPRGTTTLRIEDDFLSAGVVAILAEDPSYDNFIEGNLTYTNQGGKYDSVGIAPAVELYRSVIPFDDFASVGLALATSYPNGSATVRLRLIDEEGTERETVVRELAGRSHEAKFLSEIFSTQVERGKVEIESTALLLGTALTLTKGEISALPMLPSPVAYTVRFRYQGRTDEAEAVIWAEGAFVEGYLRFLTLNGHVNQDPATYMLSGTLLDGILRVIMFSGRSQSGTQETINALKVPGFTFDRRSYRGGFTRVAPFLTFPFNQLLGNYELVRRD